MSTGDRKILMLYMLKIFSLHFSIFSSTLLISLGFLLSPICNAFQNIKSVRNVRWFTRREYFLFLYSSGKTRDTPHHHHHHISSEEVVFWNFYYIKVVNFGPLWRIKWKCKLLFSLPAIKMPLAMRHWHKDRLIGK